MAGDAELGGLNGPQEIVADRLHLFAVCTALVEFKQFFRLSAALPHVHHVVHHQILAAEHAVSLVVADVRQLLIMVCLLVQSLLHQLP